MAAGIQRPLRGSRISTFYPIKTLPSLSSLDSAFQLQEYISLLIRLDIHDVEAITSLPGKDGEFQEGEASGEKQITVDEACWVYEQLRRLAQDLTHPLITTLQQECTRTTCPEMKAGEWLYLCVAHGNEGSMEQCCAIDYILHTLDSATALLSSPRAFPSRLQIPATSHRHFSSLARRLGRIFAHAYFHHREAFEQAEVESSLYARFLALSRKFELVPAEFLPIPPGHHDGDEEVGPRGLNAAQVSSSSSIAEQPQHEPHHDQTRQSLTLLVPPEPFQSGSPSPPGLASENSPRKPGRPRTTTMVPSDVSAFIAESASMELTGEPEEASREDEDIEELAHDEVDDMEEVIPKEETIPPVEEKGEEEEEEEEAPTSVSEESAPAEQDESVEEEAPKEEDQSVTEPVKSEETPSEAISVKEQTSSAERESTKTAIEKTTAEEKDASDDAKDEEEIAEELGGTPVAPSDTPSAETAPSGTEDGEKVKTAEAASSST